MGIINTFVNQIGRETARDVYRGTKTKRTSVSNQQVELSDTNDTLLLKVSSFKILVSEDETMRHLTNYIEEAENTTVDDFDWLDIFTELDNKIEFCKVELSERYQQKLQELDTQNQKTFSLKLAEHKQFISNYIAIVEEGLIKMPNYKIGLASSFLCFNPIYYKTGLSRIVTTLMMVAIMLFFVYWGWFFLFTEEALKLPKPSTPETQRGIKTVGYLLFTLSSLVYIGIVYRSVKRANEIRAKETQQQNLLLNLQNYFKTLHNTNLAA